MTAWAVTGGGGFLGLHLCRRLLADGHEVRSLDLEPAGLDGVEEIAGDVRDPAAAARLCRGAEVVVHAAAALPIRGSQREIWSVNVDGTATVLAAAAQASARRVVFVSSAVVLPRPIESYGRAKAEAERLCLAAAGVETAILRPQAVVGPERLGVFGILFRWVAEGRRIYTVGPGANRYQLLDVGDLVEAIVLAAERPVAGEAIALGAERFGTVAEDLRALIAHAGSESVLAPLPVRPARAAMRALHLARLSPLGEWHYRTAHRDCFVEVAPARRALGWAPRLSNAEALARAYDWYAAARPAGREGGRTHRTPWNERALALLRRLS